jgi:hypothetical protein
MLRSLSLTKKTKKKLFSKNKKGGRKGRSKKKDPLLSLSCPASTGAGRDSEELSDEKAFELQSMEEVRQAKQERDMLKAMGPVAANIKGEIQMETLPSGPSSDTELLAKGKEKVDHVEEAQHSNIAYGDADYYMLLELTHLPREVPTTGDGLRSSL